MDIKNIPYDDSLYRYRESGGNTYEEFWNSKSKSWEPTSDLTRLLVGGDCTLLQITEQSAKDLMLDNSE